MMKYNTYKENEIDWLVDVTEHWTTHRIDWVAAIVRGNTGFKRDELLDDGEYVALQYGKTYKVDVVDNDFNFFVNSEFYKKGQVVSQGDTVLISTSETLEDLGHSCYYKRDDLGLLGGEQILLKPNNKLLNEKYLYYFSKKFCAELRRYATGLKVFRFNTDDLKQVSLIIPPIEEQNAIAQYLDTKTQAIDKKVKLLEQKIDYYKELRKSLINDAVTIGLDKTVELKSTEIGIKVPKKWKRFRLKDIGKLYSGLSGKSGDDFRQDDHPDNKGFIPFTNIAANTYISEDNLGKVVVEPIEKQNKVKKGDIFFLMSSEGYDDIGKSSVLDIDLDETYLNSFCKGFRLQSKECNYHFINYLLQSDNYRQLLIIEGKGFTRINLKMEKINNFLVYLPSTREEQTEVAKYLYQQTATIEKIFRNILEQIDRLKELRKTLINDAVTGKIKVIA